MFINIGFHQPHKKITIQLTTFANIVVILLDMEPRFGRPPLFDSPEQMQEAIEKYFTSGRNTRKVEVGKGETKSVIEIPVITITGLCLYLGFESRQSFYDYEKRDSFSYTIKRARTFIECEYEEQLSLGNPTGAIFALKNFGWHDKTEQDITTNGKDITTITFKNFQDGD